MTDVSIGGDGFPKPITPETEIRRIKNTGGIDLTRGIDLSAKKDPEKHGHRWVLVAHYSVDEDQMKTLAQAASHSETLDEGEDPTPVEVGYGPETMMGMNGPGCMKCGVIWVAPGIGYGYPCPVSDDDIPQ